MSKWIKALLSYMFVDMGDIMVYDQSFTYLST